MFGAWIHLEISQRRLLNRVGAVRVRLSGHRLEQTSLIHAANFSGFKTGWLFKIM